MSLLPALQSSPLAFLGIAICIVLLGWYLVGREIERQQAIRLAHAVAALLRTIGSEGSFRWLGPGRCELRLERTRRPFTGLRIIIWLRSRALLPTVLLDWLRGRSDLVAFAADLGTSPRVQLELVEPRSSVGQRALRRSAALGWFVTNLTWKGRELTLISPDPAAAERLLRALEDRDLPSEANVVRLAVADRSPQLSLTVARPRVLVAAGRGFERWLLRAGDELASWAA
jgi:hypothetical protein